MPPPPHPKCGQAGDLPAPLVTTRHQVSPRGMVSGLEQHVQSAESEAAHKPRATHVPRGAARLLVMTRCRGAPRGVCRQSRRIRVPPPCWGRSGSHSRGPRGASGALLKSPTPPRTEQSTGGRGRGQKPSSAPRLPRHREASRRPPPAPAAVAAARGTAGGPALATTAALPPPSARRPPRPRQSSPETQGSRCACCVCTTLPAPPLLQTDVPVPAKSTRYVPAAPPGNVRGGGVSGS